MRKQPCDSLPWFTTASTKHEAPTFGVLPSVSKALEAKPYHSFSIARSCGVFDPRRIGEVDYYIVSYLSNQSAPLINATISRPQLLLKERAPLTRHVIYKIPQEKMRKQLRSIVSLLWIIVLRIVERGIQRDCFLVRKLGSACQGRGDD